MADEPLGIEIHASSDDDGCGQSKDLDGVHGKMPFRMRRPVMWSDTPIVSHSIRNALQNGPCGAVIP